MPNPAPSTAFAQIALDVARLIEQAAVALVASAAPLQAARELPAMAQAITRLARCARLEEAFARKCAEQDRAPAPPAPDQAETRAAHRRRIIRAIEDSIAAAPPHHAEYLLADFHERLDDPLLEADLLRRPVGDIIGELRNDLGLRACAARPPRRDALDVAILAARAAAPPRPPGHAAPTARQAQTPAADTS